ncbi:MAG TPA: porin [Rhizomicrobium sp.]|jgi:phosphate-selective porin OprO/OprP
MRLSALLLAGTAIIAIVPQANAAASSSTPSTEQLQNQIDQLNQELQDLKRSQSAQYDDSQRQALETQKAIDEAAKKSASNNGVQVSLKNGRPSFKSADGNFTAEIRSLVQFDNAYYGQGKAPAGTDLSSGSDFRRARLGIQGTLFHDWSYQFIYDFGGSGTEGAAISSAYIQYDGLGPVHWKIGAYPTPESFDDTTAASDLLFLERAQPTDLARGLAGSDGRAGTTLFAYGDDYYVAASYTGDLVQDSAVFDEQQAAVGRVAWRVFHDGDSNLAIGGDTTYIFKLADTAAGANAPDLVRLRERPELNVDDNSIRLIDTGNLNANDVWEWGLEAAGNLHNFYAQGGYFNFDVGRRASALPDPSFDGWYLQGSWVLTGEAKPYITSTGSYGLPKPDSEFSFDHPGIGAWEIAGRYSVLDLDYNAGIAGHATPTGGIRGGEQKIWTAGVNWYPNNAIRFVLDYQHVDVSKLSAAGGDAGATLDDVSFRVQLSL